MRQVWQRRWAAVTLAALVSEIALVPWAAANPTGPSVVAGEAAVSGLGTGRVTITQGSQRAIINWQSFNIAPNEVTQFIQPNVHAIALNRIFDQNPSQILGTLKANGTVMLLNRNGILFGPNAQVNVGGLVASTHHLSDANFLAGHYLFEGTGIEGLVKNSGAIHAEYDGVYLLASNVENHGLITSPNGTVVLGAGKTAYLSNRPDGRGFLAEITAPTGRAVNVKDIFADGGQVTMAGRVVNQEGLIRADTLRERQGKIELLASAAVTLADGSRTLARGGDTGISHGGTINALADLKSGTAMFEKGAVVDVSGGKSGGNAGHAEISAASVSLRGQFLGRAAQGFTGGRFLIDPTCVGGSAACAGDATEIASFANSGASLVEFKSATGSGLIVTGQYDLAAGEWQLPSGQRGTIKFTAASDDLVFQNFSLRNTGSGVPWDYVGTADNHVRFNQSFLETGFGGHIDITAVRGSISLVQSTSSGGNLVVQGALSIIRTPEAGGNITLTSGQDIISPSVFVKDGRLASGNAIDRFGGIRLDGVGDLKINAGRNFIGGRVNGQVYGPGFVLTNGKANVTAKQIGGPLQAGTGGKQDDEYAQLTLASGEITLHATGPDKDSGSIYLGRIQDKGLTDLISNPAASKVITVDPNNKVTVTVDNGDLHLNPTELKSSTGLPLKGTNIYPASFEANVPKGDIHVEGNLSFWGSPTGRVNFFAGRNIKGNAFGSPEALTDRYQMMYVGAAGRGGTWVLVDIAEAAKSPLLTPFLITLEKLPKSPDGQEVPRPSAVKGTPTALPDNPVSVFIGEVGRGGQWILVDRVEAQGSSILAPYLNLPAPGGAPPNPFTVNGTIAFPVGPAPLATRAIALLQATLSDLKRAFQRGTNSIDFGKVLSSEYVTSESIPGHAVADARLVAGFTGFDGTGRPTTKTAEQAKFDGDGNIVGLNVKFGSTPYLKQVTISAPGNLQAINATLAAPAGVVSLVDVGGTIKLTNDGQLAFAGTGTGRIRVGGDLDLGSSQGIRFRRFNTITSEQNQGGFLDIGVGGNVVMDRSRIATYNGASISIHGLTKTALTDTLVGVKETGADGVTRIFVNARNADGEIVRQEVKFEGKTMTVSGAPNRLDGDLTVHVALVEQNGQLVTRGGDRVEVLRVDGKTVTVDGDLVLVRPDIVARPDGTVARDGGTLFLAKASGVSEVAASGGSIKVGSNTVSSSGDKDLLGIMTRAGGAIDIKATGTIDVDKSRIATLAFASSAIAPYVAGDINLVSTTGHINAGSGGANEAIAQSVEVSPGVFLTFDVPGSGIFSYHSSDQKGGELLVFPRFDDPQINAVRAEISKQGFLGRDTTALRAKEKQLLAERGPVFDHVFESFILSKQLGNIKLVAHQGDIVVPEAGIRGRRIDLLAPNGTLDLRGGVIAGLTRFSSKSVAGSLSGSFSGTVAGSSSSGGSVSGSSGAGGGNLGGISGSTGSVSAASSSATAATTSNAVKANENVQETAADGAGQGAEVKAKQVAGKSTDKEKKTQLAQSMKMKRGVLIQVDVKPQAQSQPQPGS